MITPWIFKSLLNDKLTSSRNIFQWLLIVSDIFPASVEKLNKTEFHQYRAGRRKIDLEAFFFKKWIIHIVQNNNVIWHV